MGIYGINGVPLRTPYNVSGNELSKACDAMGNIVFPEFHHNTFSILGDSYSTYEGYMPYVGHAWYPNPGHTDVTSVEQTWWKLFENQTGLQLELNDSYSGSCICYDGYGDGTSDQRDNGASFLKRMVNLPYSQYILILGGTNDSWVPARLGSYKYSDWTESDKEYFRPAFAYMIDYITNKYPESTIVFIKNTGLGSSFSSSIDTICSHYGITEIILNNIDKQDGHPNVLGMQQINAQVRNVLGL